MSISLSAGLPERDRVPQEVRLFRRAGLLDSRNGAVPGPHLRGGRRAQRLRDIVAARRKSSDFDIMPSSAGPIKHIKGRHPDAAVTDK